MSTITISLADERLEQLRLQKHVDELLDRDEAFRFAAAYVLKKNAELHRRLA